MDSKGQMAAASSSSSSATNPAPSAPPAAPPSYEEAIGIAPHQNHGMPVTVAPSSGSPMPMPQPVAMVHQRPANQQMPMPQPAQMMPHQMTAPAQYTTTPSTPVVFPHQIQPSQTQQSAATSQVRIIYQAAAPTLGHNPVKMSCPSCRADIKTTTMSDHQPSAHICCIVLCLLGCCFCSCLPYCLSAFLSVHHFCPNCRAYLGTWKG